MSERKMRGFTLLEVMVVVSLSVIAAAVAMLGLQPLLQSSRVASAFNVTLAALRQARDLSVAQRQSYFVTFSNAAIPNTVTITQTGTGTVIDTYKLPQDVTFVAVAGIPTSKATVPDGFGAGNVAIAFDQGIAAGNPNIVYFMPDGTAEDNAAGLGNGSGNLNNGVLYIARAGQLYSSYAITVWGATGRIRGWRLFNNTGTPYWKEN